MTDEPRAVATAGAVIGVLAVAYSWAKAVLAILLHHD